MDDAVEVIRTARLELCTVFPHEFELLAQDRADPALWIDRGFSNPLRHLVEEPGPLPYRLPLIAVDPQAAPFLLRLAVLRAEQIVIGSVGFHGRPDEDGMIEIGVGVEPAYRGQGLAQEMLLGMWRWVIDQPGVTRLRYTVSPDNVPSQSIIRKLDFTRVGTQVDAVDGVEEVYELTATEYRRRFT